jgi:hypothetical protein
MKLGNPVYISKEQAYVFEFCDVEEEYTIETESYFLEPGILENQCPKMKMVQEKENGLIDFFIEQSVSFFASPIRAGTCKKRLQHKFLKGESIPTDYSSSWVRTVWMPKEMKVYKTEFVLGWTPVGIHPSEPKIAPDFLASVTPRIDSPVPETKQVHISNAIEYPAKTVPFADGLVTIGDLPLSDGVVDFGLQTEESPEKAEERRRIREARLRASLAKLKAERLANRYYQRYGNQGSSDSSELSESETSSESS